MGSNLSFVFWLMRNIGELVPWKQLVEARQTALHASIPWLASCSPCLSVFSTLPTGTHTFMPKNPLTGTIICSKATRSKNGFTSKKKCVVVILLSQNNWTKSSNPRIFLLQPRLFFYFFFISACLCDPQTY